MAAAAVVSAAKAANAVITAAFVTAIATAVVTDFFKMHQAALEPLLQFSAATAACVPASVA